AIILVSHDRYFLDQACTSFLAFGTDDNGNKTVIPMVGLAQWEIWYEEQKKQNSKQAAAAKATAKAEATKPKKLSYKDQYALDHMEENIQKAESELAELTSEYQKPENLSDSKKLVGLSKKIAAAQAEIDRLYALWEKLS